MMRQLTKVEEPVVETIEVVFPPAYGPITQGLINARTYLANMGQAGWAKGALNKGDHRVCAMGAVYDYSRLFSKERSLFNGVNDKGTDRPLADKAIGYLTAALPVMGLSYTSVASFNDAKGTKLENVLQMFDKGIELAIADNA